jgi:hypothetical protein
MRVQYQLNNIDLPVRGPQYQHISAMIFQYDAYLLKSILNNVTLDECMIIAT